MTKYTGLDRVLNLPPFWLAFAFMALISLPMSYVALPITAAPLGALPSIGIVLLVTFIMCLSTSAIVEAVVTLPPDQRPTNLRDLATVYLGKRAGLITGIAVSIVFFVVLVACLISIVSTLSSYTGMSEELWLAIVGAAILFISFAGSVTHSLSLVGGATAILLMIAIMVALIPFFEFDRVLFAELPFTDDRGLAPNLWSSFLGVIILSFIGPLLLVPSAVYVLPKSNRAKDYISGSLWGIVFQGFLMILWITLVELSVLPTQLIGLHGTVFLKLGQITDAFVRVTGTVLIFILPGLAAIRSASQLAVQIRLFVSPKQTPTTHLSAFIWKYVVPALPSIATFLFVGLLIEENEADVSHFLSIGGILGSSIATGIVPVMMYRKVKQRSDHSAVPFLRLFRHTATLLFSSLFFSIVLLLYGVVVWDSLPIQILACTLALVNLVLTVRALR